MFRLVRLIVLVMIAFLAGILLERSQHGDRCVAAGGEMRAGLCVGAS